MINTILNEIVNGYADLLLLKVITFSLRNNVIIISEIE